MKKITLLSLSLCVCLLLTSPLFSAGRVDRSRERDRIGEKRVVQIYGPQDKEYYLTAKQIAFIRPGLVLELRELTIPADLRPVVEFSIQDPKGLPLDIDGVFTPGPVSLTFLISRIPMGETQHVNYNFVTRQGADGPVTQADRDRGGTFTEVSDGVYTYRFNSALPADFDRTVPHTIGVYAARDLAEFDLGRYVENKFIHFLPTEGGVTLLDAPPRDVVRTAACNQCHNPLALHGGARIEVELCVQCHTPQSTDPESGNTVDFKVMIHKIHRGASLPSVEDGTPYQIIGFNNSVHDYSDVHFPQDIRNCETCHVPGPDQAAGAAPAAFAPEGAADLGGGTQSAAWLLRPTRAACGSCHDDVNFASGENHAGGPQISDNLCAQCHSFEGELEYGADIRGAHTPPYKSRQLEGIDIEILDVMNTAPGENPTVYFTAKTHGGTPLDPASFNRFRFNLAGPTTDYAGRILESGPLNDSVPFQDGWTYTFEAMIPQDATGTFVIGHESRRDAILNEGTTEEFAIRESMGENPLFYVAVTDPEPVPRRVVVDQNKCHRCHDLLSFHGGQRHTVQYCVTCHNPNETDVEEPFQGIHFKYHIHRIHRGEHLSRPHIVEGENFAHVRFPGDLRDCATCHDGDTYEIANEAGEFPLLPDLLPTVVPVPPEFFAPLPPISGACLGCHDSQAAAAHAYTQTAPFGESCGACHGRGAEFAVAKVHAR